MNKKELAKTLIDEKVPKNIYSLEGGLQDDTYCLDNDYDGWVTYYTEKGKIYERKVHKTEEEACEYFHARIKEIIALMKK